MKLYLQYNVFEYLYFSGHTVFHVSAVDGNLQMLEFMLQFRPSILEQDFNGKILIEDYSMINFKPAI